jgi:hypothetical protein
MRCLIVVHCYAEWPLAATGVVVDIPLANRRTWRTGSGLAHRGAGPAPVLPGPSALVALLACERSAQCPDHPNDEDPGEKNERDPERRPRTETRPWRTSLIRRNEERQLFIETQPTAAHDRARVPIFRWVMGSSHRSNLLSTGPRHTQFHAPTGGASNFSEQEVSLPGLES